MVRTTKISAASTGSHTPGTAGIEIGPGAGKFLTRVRHLLIAEHYAALIAAKSYGAVKLDLVLRIIALYPEHAGAREPGYVLWDWQYEHLHDLVKAAPKQRVNGPRTDGETRHLKRKWVSNQLAKLQEHNLVRVTPRSGRRPELVVLRDDGKGGKFDDPGEAGGRGDNRYVTIRGSLAASGTLARWRAPELVGYLAAIYAESLSDRGAGRGAGGDGTKNWWRQLAWFSNEYMHPLGRATLPFSKSLLEDGLRAHRQTKLITTRKLTADPRTHEPFHTPRVLYEDHFDHFDPTVKRITPASYKRAVSDEENPPARAQQ